MKKLMRLLAKDNRGFTLIELIVVIAILAVLAAVLVPTVTGQLNTAKSNALKANAHTVYTAVQMAVASGQTIADGATSNSVVNSILGTLPNGGTYVINVTGGVYSVTYTDSTGSATYPGGVVTLS